MQSCLSSADAAIGSGESPAAGTTPAGTLAVRVADLQVRIRGTVTAAGAAPSKGEMTLFCRPVVTAPAFVKRDGTVLADAWLPDLVRLGGLEEHLGDGVIEAIAGKALRAGRLRPRERRRLMSYPLVIRLVIAMTLLPGASYAEAVRVLAGLLADIPFTLDWHVPTGKTITEWRLLVPAEVMEEIFWHAAGPLIGDGDPSAVVLAGMPVGAADGMLVNVAESPENRAYFGTTGTAVARQESQHGAHRAEPLEQVEDQPDHAAHLLVRVQHHLAGGAAREPDRQRHRQLAAAGLGDPPGPHPLPDQVQFSLAEGALEPSSSRSSCSAGS